MAYSFVAARVPEKDKRDLDFVMDMEHLDRSSAARKVMELGLTEWKKQEALKKLEVGRFTMSAAARFAGISIWEMVELVKQRKVHYIRISDKELQDEMETVD